MGYVNKTYLSTQFKNFADKIAKVFSKIGHTHLKSDITDFPTSMPANGGNAATVGGHTVGVNVPSNAKFTDTTYGVATSSALGLVKSGTDITVDSSGNVSVNDDSHNHVISNVDGLQNALDGKAASSHTHNYAGSSSAGGSANSALGLAPSTISNIDELDSFLSDKVIMKYAKASNCNIGFVSNDGLVISLPWSSKYGAQIAIDDQSNWMGIRTKSNGTWNSWSKIALESEIELKLSGKADSSHTHNYAGSSSAGGSATSAVKLDSSAGSATQPIYFSSGKPVACTYTLGKSVPSNAVFTDTWRGIQNNLTSDSTTDSLSANQGKVLKGLIDEKTNKEVTVAGSSGISILVAVEPSDGTVGAGSRPDLYTYTILPVYGTEKGTICQGNDSRLSNARPASDVYAWAKAASKPSYTAAEVGAIPTTASCNKNWHWYGQSGQPYWLWGSNDGTNMYVYNPSNFNVANAAAIGGYTFRVKNVGNINVVSPYKYYQVELGETPKFILGVTSNENAIFDGGAPYGTKAIFFVRSWADERYTGTLTNCKIAYLV